MPPSHFFGQFFQKNFFSKNVILVCFSTRWIRIWHPFFNLRLLCQDMPTFTTKMSTSKMAFYCVKYEFFILNTHKTQFLIYYIATKIMGRLVPKPRKLQFWKFYSNYSTKRQKQTKIDNESQWQYFCCQILDYNNAIWQSIWWYIRIQ